MSLIPWKTRGPENGGHQLPSMSGFRGELDRLFDSFFHEVAPWGERGWGPPLDVEETDKEIHVRAEIPGVKPQEIDISIAGGALVISGEKKESEEKREKGYVYQERRYGSFRREVPLPTAVDEANVLAEYKDGVLSVTLKKSEEALPRKIQVKAK
jgi:HSP20 family protein